MQIHQIPVLFGRGRRLFDELPSSVELEIVALDGRRPSCSATGFRRIPVAPAVGRLGPAIVIA
jgi:hypothetical protein